MLNKAASSLVTNDRCNTYPAVVPTRLSSLGKGFYTEQTNVQTLLDF
jgi:hypothetical protein